MDKNKVFQHYSNILDNLIKDSVFLQVYFQSCCTFDDDLQLTNHLTLSTGISRGCLIDSNYNYVVKFNLNDQYNCDKEIRIYTNAINYNLAHFFAEPTYIGKYTTTINTYAVEDIDQTISIWYGEEDFNDQLPIIKENCVKRNIVISINLFAYPRAEICKKTMQQYSIEDETYAENSDSPLNEYNLAIAAAFIADYGADEYNRLTEFLYEWNINDIHLGNVGEINNHIVIIDYAGV